MQATSDIYADLRNDGQAMKLVDAWLRLYQTSGGSMEQEGDKEAIIWLAKQEKQNPAMVARIGIEILRREKNMDCKAYMIGEISGLPNTDMAPLIDEIRNQLHQLPRKDDGSIRSDGLDVLETSAIVISRLGEKSDKQLLMSLIQGCPDTLKKRVTDLIGKLDERLTMQASNSRPQKSRGEQSGSASSSERSKPIGIVSFFTDKIIWITGCGLLFLWGILLTRKLVIHLKQK